MTPSLKVEVFHQLNRSRITFVLLVIIGGAVCFGVMMWIQNSSYQAVCDRVYAKLLSSDIQSVSITYDGTTYQTYPVADIPDYRKFVSRLDLYHTEALGLDEACSCGGPVIRIDAVPHDQFRLELSPGDSFFVVDGKAHHRLGMAIDAIDVLVKSLPAAGGKISTKR